MMTRQNRARKFATVLRHSSIKTKLLMLTLMLVVLPLSVTCVILYASSTRLYADSVDNVSRMSLKYISDELESKLTTVLNTANNIVIHEQVQMALLRDTDRYPLVDQLNDMKDLARYFNGLQIDTSVNRIRLSVREGLIYTNDKQNFISSTALLQHNWYKQIIAGESKANPCFWIRHFFNGAVNIPEPQNAVSCVKVIHNIENYDDVLGLVFVDIAESEISAILKKGILTRGSAVFAINQEGIVMSSAGETRYIQAMDQVVQTFDNDRTVQEIDGTRYQLHVARISRFNWTLVSFVSLSALDVERRRLAWLTLLLLAGLAGATLFAGQLLYRSSLDRIDGIVTKMQAVQQGSLTASIALTSDDEIGQIEQNFNYMIHRIKDLVDETYQLVEQTKAAELKALQAQINPHFLYNTLNTISWTAIDYGAEKVSLMLRYLSDYYKLCLQPGKSEVLLSEEIQHVNLYIKIQNLRYGDYIIFEDRVPEELKSLLMPNMILQPLIENSFLHGILARSDHRGTITLAGERIEGTLILRVTDNGVGMSTDALQALINIHVPKNEYGLYSIQERLHLKYGNPYGLIITSQPDAGTTVEVSLPVRQAGSV
jgi:two-component system sensor histidine kinase YesM